MSCQASSPGQDAKLPRMKRQASFPSEASSSPQAPSPAKTRTAAPAVSDSRMINHLSRCNLLLQVLQLRLFRSVLDPLPPPRQAPLPSQLPHLALLRCNSTSRPTTHLRHYPKASSHPSGRSNSPVHLQRPPSLAASRLRLLRSPRLLCFLKANISRSTVDAVFAPRPHPACVQTISWIFPPSRSHRTLQWRAMYPQPFPYRSVTLPRQPLRPQATQSRRGE